MTDLAIKLVTRWVLSGLLLIGLAGSGLTLANPYQTQILLSATNPDQPQAIKSALERVLVKVSGNKMLAANNDLALVLSQADAYVSEFAYIEKNQVQADEFAEPVKQQWLQVSFQKSLVQSLLRQLQQPIWLHKRPKVLVLAALERDMVGAQNQLALAQAVELAGEARGLPLVLPLWDLSEQRQFSLAGVRNFNSAKLQGLQQAYNADAVLVARLSKLSNGMCLAKWRFQYQPAPLTFIQDQQQNCEQLLQQGIDKVSDWLAQRSSVQASNQTQGSLLVQVDNIKSYQDYADLMAYLRFSKVKLLLANSAIQSVEGQSLVFDFSLLGSKAELAKLLAQEGKLKPASNASQVSVDWHLRWQNN